MSGERGWTLPARSCRLIVIVQPHANKWLSSFAFRNRSRRTLEHLARAGASREVGETLRGLAPAGWIDWLGGSTPTVVVSDGRPPVGATGRVGDTCCPVPINRRPQNNGPAERSPREGFSS